MKCSGVVLAVGASLLLALGWLLPGASVAMAASGTEKPRVSVVESNPTTGTWLQSESSLTFSPILGRTVPQNAIVVDPYRQYQTIQGFGGALTDSSAWLMDHSLNATERLKLERYFYGRAAGDLGLNLLRLPMGASDMSASGNYTYDQVSPGKTDPTLSKFSIAHDLEYIIPELRQIRKIDPSLEIVATPWSPPAWMKTTDSMNGGELLRRDYGVYAEYFVKFLEDYEKAGVPIQYITPQNEPLNDTTTYPGMLFPANAEATFIAKYLGPDLAKAGLTTKILAYDHNWNVPSYPVAVLKNSRAKKYVAGVAWHCYAGAPDVMRQVHAEFPSTTTLVTECSGGTWQGGTTTSFEDEVDPLLIHSIRDGAQGIILWNLALNPENGPTNGGCTTCRGIVTIDGNSYQSNVDAYALGLLSRTVLPGARRIASNTLGLGSVEDVAFRDPNGKIVTLVFNSGNTAKTFHLVDGTSEFTDTIQPSEALTFAWQAGIPGRTLDLQALSASSGTRKSALDLYGNGFGSPSGQNAVDVGGVSAKILFWSNRLIRIQVPSAVGLGNAQVQVTSAGITSNALPYTVLSILPSDEWIASASSTDTSGDVPANALELTPAARWSTGQPQAPGEWFEVDLNAPETFNRLVMNAGFNFGDGPSAYRIYVSSQGTHWKLVYSGVGTGQSDTAHFPMQTAQYVKVVNEGSSGNWWSIAEFILERT